MRASLPAATGLVPEPRQTLTPLNERRSSSCGEWRILELISATQAPFEVFLSWSAGDDNGMNARIVVPRATRISIFAAWIQVEMANRASVANDVICTGAPGYAVTSNQWEESGAGNLDNDLPVSVDVPIPPFAHAFQVHTEKAGDLPLVGIEVYDGLGTQRLGISADLQPDGGVALGSAHRLTLKVSSSVKWRVVFLLTI